MSKWITLYSAWFTPTVILKEYKTELFKHVINRKSTLQWMRHWNQSAPFISVTERLFQVRVTCNTISTEGIAVFTLIFNWIIYYKLQFEISRTSLTNYTWCKRCKICNFSITFACCYTCHLSITHQAVMLPYDTGAIKTCVLLLLCNVMWIFDIVCIRQSRLVLKCCYG